MSDCVAESVKRRPIRRFASNTVFVGFIAHWFLAASPIIRSKSVNATNDGVVRLPWSLAMISTRSFCQMPTHEYVVPRSMPTAAPSLWNPCPCSLGCLRRRGRAAQSAEICGAGERALGEGPLPRFCGAASSRRACTGGVLRVGGRRATVWFFLDALGFLNGSELTRRAPASTMTEAPLDLLPLALSLAPLAFPCASPVRELADFGAKKKRRRRRASGRRRR